jgi:DNA-binding response OmpR family regulator
VGSERQDRPLILIVDDDEGFHAAATAILERAGFETAVCERGDEALDAVRRERPRAVIVDVRLPGLSGHELCRKLKSEFGEALPVLFVSGVRTESFDRVGGLILGADDFLVKPFSADELLARVRSLIRRSEEGRSASGQLTEEEAEVLQLLAEGLESADIASRLDVDPETIRERIAGIATKVGA